MPAAAPHRHLELIRRRIDHAAVARHQPVGQHRLHVRADHRPHVVPGQDPRCGHVQGARGIRLLPRLQHDEQTAAERRPVARTWPPRSPRPCARRARTRAWRRGRPPTGRPWPPRSAARRARPGSRWPDRGRRSAPQRRRRPLPQPRHPAASPAPRRGSGARSRTVPDARAADAGAARPRRPARQVPGSAVLRCRPQRRPSSRPALSAAEPRVHQLPGCRPYMPEHSHNDASSRTLTGAN